MKTINRKDFTEIGTVARVHGTKGELKVILNRKIKWKEWAFLCIREKPVPFYIESARFTFDDEVILKLRDIDTIDDAAPMCGYALLVPSKGIKKLKAAIDESITGYLLVDDLLGELGIIEEILEMPMQLLIKITYQERELLIPAVDPILKEIDDGNRIVYVNIPNGLIDI